jgi:hypothetical protein
VPGIRTRNILGVCGLATAIAIALVVLAILAYFTASGSGALEGVLLIVAFAGLVWLVGGGILYLLARR